MLLINEEIMSSSRTKSAEHYTYAEKYFDLRQMLMDRNNFSQIY
jgi:hypothetical protein